MIYVKSVLAGVAALVVALILFFYLYGVFFIPKAPPGIVVLCDVSGFITHPVFLLILLLAFAIGFYWEFRRASV
jgi:hypothetical protein